MAPRTLKIACLVTAGLLATSLGGCASCSRSWKSMESDFSGGLRRTVTLYSNTGEEIRSWKGKFDLSESSNEIYFDLDDKRVVIHGGIVVVEED